MSDILVTGAISYMNSRPHIGHLYENILGDFIKNQWSLLEYTSKFLTGADEHGIKIMKSAKDNDMEPQNFCDKNVIHFVEMNNKYQIGYDHYVRTTDTKHKNNVRNCIETMFNKDDIYMDKYTGYYSVREESYVTDDTAKKTNYMDPISGKPYDLISEESYFFKLGKYKNDIEGTVKKIIPERYQKDIEDRLDNFTNINDLSISRTSFNWGIPFPRNDKHIVYVWADALLSYYTGSQYLYSNNQSKKVVHLIGKDIVWFHSVYMPAILKSGDINIETDSILVHGFVCDKNGKKMSKSLNNVISPDELDIYPSDAVRFYLLTEAGLGDDINFSIQNMIDKYDLNLIDNFGNLVQRLCNLCINSTDELNNCDIMLDLDVKSVVDMIKSYDLTGYYNYVQDKIRALNLYLTEEKPWDKSIDIHDKIVILKTSLCKLDYITKLMYPYIPNKIVEIRNIFGFKNSMSIYDKNIGNLNIQYEKDHKIFAYIVSKNSRKNISKK